MTPGELERLIEKGKLPSLLFLYGEEAFTLERMLKRLIQATVPEDARDFNLTIMHHKDFSSAKLLDAARTFPIFCNHRMIVIKDAHQIAAAELDPLSSYIHDPSPETILVFVAEKIDARRKFFLDFKKHGELVEFKKLYDNQMPSAIRDLAQAVGLSLTEEALAVFCRRVSSNLQDVHTELEKLAVYVGERKLADVADINAVVTGSRQETVFALNDALGECNAKRSIQLVERILDEGIPGLVVLSMMVRHFRNLWKIREMVEQNRTRTEMAKIAAVNPYFLDGLIRQSRNFSARRLRKIFELFLVTDLSLKSAAAHQGVLLEKVVLAICAE